MIRILNWNTNWASPRRRRKQFAIIKQVIADHDPDIVCLTEAHPDAMPEGGETISSGISGEGYLDPESQGSRKVVLWSRFGWSKVDAIGSKKLPPGRFAKAAIGPEFNFLTIIGVCVPYAHYRNHAKWGAQRKTFFQGACEYLDALREDYLPRLVRKEFAPYYDKPVQTVMLGDFNLQIPPFNYPYPNSDVNQKRKQLLDGWLIPTAGISRHFVNHIAMSSGLRIDALRYITRRQPGYDGDLTDHNGVVMDLQPGKLFMRTLLGKSDEEDDLQPDDYDEIW